jgi:hypothetical protein
MKKFILPAALSILLLAGCYKDKVSELYPGSGLFVPCDTTHTPSYSQNIAPLLQNYCVGCHSGSNPTGGANFTTYSGVYQWASDASPSKMEGSAWHLRGFNPMPPSFELDTCQLKMIQYWCANGAPNN